MPESVNQGLYIAAVDKQWDKVRELLAKRTAWFGSPVNVDACPAEGQNRGITALWCAAANKQWSIVRELLDKDANVDACSAEGPNRGKTALWIAASYSQWDIVPELLTKGAQNIDACPEEGPDRGITALYYAAVDKRWNIVLELLAKGANVDACPEEGPNRGITALWCAAANKQWSIVRELLDKDANVDACSAEGPNRGKTALWIAASYSQWDIVPELLAKGAQNIDACPAEGPNRGKTVLWCAAAANKQWDIVYELLAKGAQNIDACPEEGPDRGKTALCLAAANKQWDIVHVLLAKGANVKDHTKEVADQLIKNGSKNTLLHYAAASDREDLYDLLKQQGVYLEKKNGTNKTALHCACQHGALKTFNRLLEDGANLYFPDIEGKMPIHLLIENGHSNLLESICGNSVIELPFEVMVRSKLIFPRLNSGANMIPVKLNLLHCAIRSGQTNMLKQLLKYYRLHGQIDFDSEDDDSLKPVHLAAKLGNIDALQCLSEFSPWLGVTDKLGNTALHHAVIAGQFETVKYLAAHSGIDIEAQNNAAQTVEELAKAGGKKQISGYLKNKKLLGARANPELAATPINITNLVFQGGSVKGLAYVGVYEVLQGQSSKIALKNIKRVCGASVGSITAVLFGVDYSLTEMKEIMQRLDIVEFLDGESQQAFLAIKEGYENLDAITGVSRDVVSGFTGLIKQIVPPIVSKGINHAAQMLKTFIPKGVAKQAETIFKGSVPLGLAMLSSKTRDGVGSAYEELAKDGGIFKGEAARQWIDDIVRVKTGIKDATFGELHAKKEELLRTKGITIRDIYVVALNISAGRLEIFSHETHPDVVISSAVRASMSIPVIFKAYQILVKTEAGVVVPFSDNYYVDGGVADNYPVWVFDQQRYLATAADDCTDTTRVINRETLGFRLVAKELKDKYEQGLRRQAGEINSPLDIFKQFVSLFLGDHLEGVHRRRGDVDRTVYIDIYDVGMLDFDLTEAQKDALMMSGQLAMYEAQAKFGDPAAIDFNKEILICLLNNGAYFKHIESASGSTLKLHQLSFDRVTPEKVLTIFMTLTSKLRLSPEKLTGLLFYLKKLGLNPNIVSAKGQTALHLAMTKKRGSMPAMVIESLLRVGSKIDHLDNQGESLLDAACQNEDSATRNSNIAFLIKQKLFSCQKPGQVYAYAAAGAESLLEPGSAAIYLKQFLLHHLAKYARNNSDQCRLNELSIELLAKLAMHIDGEAEIRRLIAAELGDPQPPQFSAIAAAMAVPRIADHDQVEPEAGIRNLVFHSTHIAASNAFIGILRMMHNSIESPQQIDLTKIEQVCCISGSSIVAGFFGLGFSVDAIEGMVAKLTTEELLGKTYAELLGTVKERYDNTTKLLDVLNRFFPCSKFQGKWRKLLGLGGLLMMPNLGQQGAQLGALGTEAWRESGVVSADSIRNWLEDKIKQKHGDGTITFAELEEKVGAKELHILALNLTRQNEAQDFCCSKTPNVVIVDAICAAIAMPLIYRPCKVREKTAGEIKLYGEREGDLFADASAANYYPIDIFDHDIVAGTNSQTLGVRLVNKHIEKEHAADAPPQRQDIDGPISLYRALVSFFHDHGQLESEHRNSGDQKRTIYVAIPELSQYLNLELSTIKTRQLIDAAKLAMYKYYDQHVADDLRVTFQQHDALALILPRCGYSPYYGRGELNIHNFRIMRSTPEDVYAIAKIIEMPAALNYLQKIGLKIDVFDKRGNTALHLAIEHTDLEAVRKLLQANAGLFRLQKGRIDYLDFALQIRENVNVPLIMILLSYGFYDCKNPQQIYQYTRNWVNRVFSSDLEKGLQGFLEHHKINLKRIEQQQLPMAISTAQQSRNLGEDLIPAAAGGPTKPYLASFFAAPKVKNIIGISRGGQQHRFEICTTSATDQYGHHNVCGVNVLPVRSPEELYANIKIVLEDKSHSMHTDTLNAIAEDLPDILVGSEVTDSIGIETAQLAAIIPDAKIRQQVSHLALEFYTSQGKETQKLTIVQQLKERNLLEPICLGYLNHLAAGNHRISTGIMVAFMIAQGKNIRIWRNEADIGRGDQPHCLVMREWIANPELHAPILDVLYDGANHFELLLVADEQQVLTAAERDKQIAVLCEQFAMQQAQQDLDASGLQNGPTR
ncbi:MAG: ankyrin repeat domain-containing protein [Gammaproteobacteria bacterium]|nr:ankyrin repeat domain-containing protein [Gammaproteobacteria bacterium]